MTNTIKLFLCILSIFFSTTVFAQSEAKPLQDDTIPQEGVVIRMHGLVFDSGRLAEVSVGYRWPSYSLSLGLRGSFQSQDYEVSVTDNGPPLRHSKGTLTEEEISFYLMPRVAFPLWKNPQRDLRLEAHLAAGVSYNRTSTRASKNVWPTYFAKETTVGVELDAGLSAEWSVLRNIAVGLGAGFRARVEPFTDYGSEVLLPYGELRMTLLVD